MNSLSLQEIKRILNVLDTSTDELNILRFLPQNMNAFPVPLLKSFPQKTQDSLRILYDDEQNLKSCYKEDKYSDNIPEITDRVHDSVRTVCSCLRKINYPIACQDKLYQIESPSVARFLMVMKELRVVFAGKLHSTVEVSKMKEELQNDTAAKEKKAKADVKALLKELSSEKSIREREVSLREESLNKLQEDLDQIKNSATDEINSFHKDIQQTETAASAIFTKKYEFFTKEIEKWTAELAKLKELHKNSEINLKHNRKKAEQIVENKLKTYDDLMNEKTAEKNSYDSDFNRDQERVDFLQKELTKFKSAREKREEEERLQKEAELREKKMKHRMKAASLTIQMFWRRYWEGMKKKKNASKKRQERQER